MIAHLASLVTPLLRLIEPEDAHGIALQALKLGLAGRASAQDDPRLGVTVLGQFFRNPIGLAAGFDKNAVALGPLARLGFGFVEAGTVTPLPQPGNPRPRLFRLAEDRAVINRMGFNNGGLAAYLPRLGAYKRGVVPVGAGLEGFFGLAGLPVFLSCKPAAASSAWRWWFSSSRRSRTSRRASSLIV